MTEDGQVSLTITTPIEAEAEAAIDVYTLQTDHINSNFRYRAFMHCVKNLKIIFLLQFWYE